jgi:hypothetical protein
MKEQVDKVLFSENSLSSLISLFLQNFNSFFMINCEKGSFPPSLYTKFQQFSKALLAENGNVLNCMKLYDQFIMESSDMIRSLPGAVRSYFLSVFLCRVLNLTFFFLFLFSSALFWLVLE